MGYLIQAMAYYGFWAVWRWEFCTIALVSGLVVFSVALQLAALPVLFLVNVAIAHYGRSTK
ncbi:hypothetical protein QUB68_25845 [Microcoleus sp. A006_D1]|uniref:hypothetical protein n=1 Tax=Microcoleus sp. A006_D1 TaxID=3055267 RepID=UPI002FD43CE6